MQQFQQALLAIWQEVSRQGEIGGVAAAVARHLREHVPLERLELLRLDLEASRFVTAAASPAVGGSTDTHPVDARTIRSLRSWHRKGQSISSTHSSDRGLIEALGLREFLVAGRIIAMPLPTQSSNPGIVVVTALPAKRFQAKHESLLETLREPLAVALDKDARFHELTALREATEADRRTLLRRLGRKDSGETIVGADAGLAHVMERVEMVSRSDVPVLLLGETGTGKEVLARAIHTRSARAQGPFLRVNCGAIPAELIDSQLFGHEKGSFTGANESRKGWFERADQGTLLLDEIGELTLDAQIRFLRVLQDGSVERVGGHEGIRVNVRIIAATHRDLASMVQQRTFREDLWYRIAVFPILVPPLRERRDDIGPLARHFAERAAVRFGLAPVEPTNDDIRLLQRYSWPGNIRELAAVIDRAAILGDGLSLEVAAALGISHGASASDQVGNIPRGAVPSPPAESLSLDDAIRRHVEMVLQKTRGRIEGAKGAAAVLQVNPHTLRARMRKLGIDWSRYREE